MSYNNGWNDNSNLPVPSDRIVVQQVNPRSVMPPSSLQVSDQIRQYAPDVLHALIEFIQCDQYATPLRKFTFNMYGQNGFQNDPMLALLKTTCNIVDMQMVASNGNAPIYDVIRTWCERSVKFVTAISMRDYPGLRNGAPAEAINECQRIAATFEQTVSELERSVRGGNGWANNGGRQQNNAPAWQQASGGGQPNRVTTTPMWVQESNSGRQQTTTPAWQQATSSTSNGWAQTQSTTETPMSTQANTSQALPVVAFVRSDEFPYDMAYDPNTYQLDHEANEQFVEPIAKRKPVDKQAHIGRPSFTPEWVTLPKIAEVLAAVEDSSNVIGGGKIVEIVGLDDNIETLTTEEGWRKTHAKVITANKPDRIVCAATRIAIVDGFVSKFDVFNLISSFKTASDHGQLAYAIKHMYEQVGKDPDARQFLDKIDARLTKMFNHFIAVEMALPYGSFDNYVEDILDAANFINKQYGESVGKVFDAAFKRITTEAFSVVDSTSENYSQMIDQYMNHMDLTGVFVGFFLDTVLLTQIDLTSPELCFDLPENTNVAMVREGPAPIFFNIAKSIVDSDDSCSTRLLKTADGVVFELSRGAFNSTALLVSRSNF